VPSGVSSVAVEPRRTVLDSRLSHAAWPADGAATAAQRAFTLRVMAPRDAAGVPASPNTLAVTTVKLLVPAEAVAEAVSWIEGQHGAVTSYPREPRGPDRGARRTVALLADLPLTALSQLDQRAWARRAEAPKRLLATLDQARGEITGLDAALAEVGNAGLTGAGVLIGIVDTGVDWSHPDFRRADGSTRLERFVLARYDGTPPVSHYERYDAAQIDAALGGGPPVPRGDPHGHGTHCLSIAAGNGLGQPDGRYRGVAPEAALLAVRSEPLLDDHTITGIRETFELAGDRPAVVTLSLGSHFGAHDGTTALENEIARASGPGRIVVVAAGNEGEDEIHTQTRLVPGVDTVVRFRVSDPEFQGVDVWIPRGDEVDVWLQRPDGLLYEPNGGETGSPYGDFRVDFVENPLNRDLDVTVLLAGGRVNDVWAVRIRPLTVVHGQMHAWGGTFNPVTNGFLFLDPVPGFSVGMPATEERAISVTSLVSRGSYEGPAGPVTLPGLVPGELSSFSSRGPTRYGGQKPDVAAPGQVVTAALAAGSELSSNPRYAERRHPSGRYISIQGTSMATPFVAGMVALLLQREPTLTPEEVQQRLRVTARRDMDTGPVWNDGFGWGKLDARALLGFSGGQSP
jgi:subtilisin family serine protease